MDYLIKVATFNADLEEKLKADEYTSDHYFYVSIQNHIQRYGVIYQARKSFGPSAFPEVILLSHDTKSKKSNLMAFGYQNQEHDVRNVMDLIQKSLKVHFEDIAITATGIENPVAMLMYASEHDFVMQMRQHQQSFNFNHHR